MGTRTGVDGIRHSADYDIELLKNNARVLHRAFMVNWQRSRIIAFRADMYDTLPQEFWFHLLVHPPYRCTLERWNRETAGGFELSRLLPELTNPTTVCALNADGSRQEVASVIAALDLNEVFDREAWLEAARKCTTSPIERTRFNRKRTASGYREWVSFEPAP